MKKLYLLLLLFTSFIYAQDPFITTWQVQGSNLTINVPVFGDGYTIDFGDGTILTNRTQTTPHTYAGPGTYTVTISGNYDYIMCVYGGSASKLLTVEQWGSNQWTTMETAFKGCTNMTINATDIPDLSLVTSMAGMFMDCTSFNGNINNWDVSNITNMQSVFNGADVFNQPLGNWDVSNVTTMKAMFSGAGDFNQPLNSWNVSSVTDMERMFQYATIFNQPLDNWNVSNVTNMRMMFNYALEFNGSINNWDVGNVTNMSMMFYGADLFNQPINDWDVSSVTTMREMFYEAFVFNQPIGNWDVSNVTDMSSMFQYTNEFNQPLNSWDTSSLVDVTWMFLEASSFNQPLDNWDVSNVPSMEGMFLGASSFNGALNNWDVSNVTNMHWMFDGATSFNQPINDWDVTSVTNMSGMLAGADNFNQPLNNWDVSGVSDLSYMLYEADNFNQDLSSWDFSNMFSFSDFVAYSGLDTHNYDALLLRFAQLEIEGVTFFAYELEYCDVAVRDYLMNTLGWFIHWDNLGSECTGNDISGAVRLDEDVNGCDPNDVAVTSFLVNAGNGSFNYSTLPSADGAYSLNLQDDAYTVNLLNVPSYYTVNPATAPVSFTGFGNSESLNFCLTANQAIEDLNITVLPLNEARPGFESNYQLVVKNMGTQTVASASVSLTFDDALQTYVDAVPAPAATTANQLNFIINDLQPFESSVIDLTMQTFTPPTVNGGEVAIFTATVTPNASDYTPADNSFELAQIVVNSYDPNDKRVLQGETIFIEQADEYLDYIIRFQNTGSASAITVRIEDELHDKLDWTTLTPVSASHNYRVEITDGNHVEFIFDNINLPHQAANDAGSNGFIAYKIKPVANAEIGDIISGNASIYFDYNLPIITNIVTTEIIEELSVGDNYFNNQVIVYPNPAKNVLHLIPAEYVQLEEVKIINLQGRELINIKAGFEAINVESLSQGVYLLVIKTNKGSLQQKLVKN